MRPDPLTTRRQYRVVDPVVSLSRPRGETDVGGPRRVKVRSDGNPRSLSSFKDRITETTEYSTEDGSMRLQAEDTGNDRGQ